LDIVAGYKVPFQTQPQQRSPPKSIPMTREKMSLVDKEVQSLLEKGAIKEIQSEEGKFFSSIFLVEKKDSGQRPVKT